jgi:hypothetical protein
VVGVELVTMVIVVCIGCSALHRGGVERESFPTFYNMFFFHNNTSLKNKRNGNRIFLLPFDNERL